MSEDNIQKQRTIVITESVKTLYLTVPECFPFFFIYSYKMHVINVKHCLLFYI